MTTNHGDELGTDRSQRHWRLVTVQAGGGLTVVRQKTRRSMQQLHLAGFLAKHSCTVAGIGDTRLGDDITSFTTSVKHAAHAEHARAVEAKEGSETSSPGRPVTSSWYSSGSSADRNGVWRGGVATGSYGEAQQRLHGHITDCRGWGRYRGAIYQGREGRKLVVVQAYFPDSEYVKTEKRCGNYSFELGVLAEKAPSGVSRSSWKPGKVPPKPPHALVRHPKRLLMDDVTMHLSHYANDKKCTLVIMGDANTDLTKDDGRDLPNFKRMLTDLSLVSAAQSRWKAASLHFKTRKGDAVHQPSHIDYILISSRSVSAIKAFGVAAPADLMIDYDHSILFCDLDVTQLLELGTRKPASDLAQRHKSQIRYSDKKRVARFRTYATDLYEKQGVAEKVRKLIGDLALDDDLIKLGREAQAADAEAGWDACHWRPNKLADVATLRGKIDEAMRLLDEFATSADVGFQSTHGKSQRRRDPGSSRSSKQFGMGWSQQAVDTARRIATIRCMAKDVYEENWQQCFARAAALESEGVPIGVVSPRTPRAELLAHFIGVRRQLRKNLQGKRRAQMVHDSGTASTKSLRQRKRAATKREVDAIMERPCRSTLSAVTVGTGDRVDVLTEPTEVAQECCDYGTRRFGSMEPKWFRPHDIAEGHDVYTVTSDEVVQGTVVGIDNDGHYAIKTNEGVTVVSKRDDTCHTTVSRSTPSAQTVRATAKLRHGDERDTVSLFSRTAEGRRTRQRAVRGALTPEEIAEIPEEFHSLLQHLQSPVSSLTGKTVEPADYVHMARADGTPNPITFNDLRRKLGGIAKQKAPGYSGNGPDLYAAMPDVWAADVLTLLNVIQHSGVTPHGWHVDLMHYVHKGGDDSSLSNHRPLTLVDVLRKVFSSVPTSRMRRDWTRLRILDTCNPGFEPGRSTVNSIYPLRMAAEQCLADEEELVAFLDDLKWCFDMPAQVVIELALLRLGVPDFYFNMLDDIDVHTAKTTITAAGITADLLKDAVGGGIHRQEHGTGQGTIDGPQKWIAVADMVISVARAASTAPVTLPVDASKAVCLDRTWFVDDSGLFQCGVRALSAVQTVVNDTGLMNTFLGMERRAKKCLWSRLKWRNGRLMKSADSNDAIVCKTWLAHWENGRVSLSEGKPAQVRQLDHDEEFRHLGYTASLSGTSSKAMDALRAVARRMTFVFQSRPSLRDCGASIVQSVLLPKLVYMLAYAKATAAQLLAIEQSYSLMLRHSLSCDASFPWDVLTGAEEQDGMGAVRLATEVTKARLRHCQAIATSPTAGENVMVLALARSAQRWVGSRQPVNVLPKDLVPLFEPLDSTAPAGAHLFGELRRAGYLLGIDWSHKQPALNDVTILEAAAAKRGRQLTELQQWRRGHGVLWVSELLRVDGRTPRRRYSAQLRAASGEEEARLRRVLFGPGRLEAGPARRVGLPTLEAWTAVRTGDWLWVDSVLNQVVSADGGRVKARVSILCDVQQPGRVDFLPGEVVDVTRHVAPMLVDSASETDDGLYSMEADEHSMILEVARGVDSSGDEPASKSRRTDGRGGDLIVDEPGVDEARGEYTGCRDIELLTPLHQILPYGSQYRDTTSSAGHAWVNADISGDEQVKHAVAQVEAAIRRHAGTQTLVLSAYSDGSVTGRGIAGSAAIVIETTDGEVVATIRLAPTDVALSSGRTEWVGLVMVLVAAASHPATIELRLDNIQVVNTFNDGRRKYVRDWLKRTDRDVASLAWSLAEERERKGQGGLVAIHIKAHAEDRKSRSQFTHHEVMNVRADELTHAITQDMPMYASFRRPVTGETTLWYQPSEYENVGRGAMYEVTGNAYKHITLTAQRRASTRRQLEKDGEMLATHVRMSTGRTRSDGMSSRVTKLIHQRLPTEARVELWAGKESGVVKCGCGHQLEWANREQVGQLQWHMFTCTLPEETNVRRRWLQAVRRDVSTYVKDAAVVRIIVRCWSHTSDGHIAAARLDENQRWRVPSMRWKGGAWRFDDVIRRTHDAGDFDTDGDDEAPNRKRASTSSITQNDQYDVDWDDINVAQSPTVEAARLLHTARQMVDTSRWWLMRWPRNATALLVRAGNLQDDEASKLFRALRVTAIRFGLELAALPKSRHDAEEAASARTALRKRWVAVVGKLGPGYRAKRGAEMPDWVAVAHLPSYKVRRTLQRWLIEVPRAVMPNRQRTMHSFYTTTGARLSTGPTAQLGPSATAAGRTAETETTSHRNVGPAPQRPTPPSATPSASGPPSPETAAAVPVPPACTDSTDGGRAHTDGLAPDATGEEVGEPEQPEAEQSYREWTIQACDELMDQLRRAAAARREGTPVAPPDVRRHDISRVPTPWGKAPQQDALRGVITAHDSDGRCSYAAKHKCRSTNDRWARCLVVDHPDDADFWSDLTRYYTSTRERRPLVDLVRCERCAVGIHPACAVDYSEWSGKAGEPGGRYDNRDVLRGALLCCKCFDDHLPYAWADDPDYDPELDAKVTRDSELPWWVTEVDLPLSVPMPESHPAPSPPPQPPPQLPSPAAEPPPPSPERRRDAPTLSPSNPPLRSPRRDANPQPLKSRRSHVVAPHPTPHEERGEASARAVTPAEPSPPRTGDANPPAPLPPPEPPPHSARAQLHETVVPDTTAAGATSGGQARDGALPVNVRKRMGPTLDSWVVRKRERK